MEECLQVVSVYVVMSESRKGACMEALVGCRSVYGNGVFRILYAVLVLEI
jgi:hypothetical protein